MLGTYRRQDASQLEDLVRRAYADHAAAGRPRPTGDELRAAAGGRWGAAHLQGIARRLRRDGALPDLPLARAARDVKPPIDRAEAEARAAALAGERAGPTPAIGCEPPPWRRWAKEHMERERALGIGRRGDGGILHHRVTEDTEKDEWISSI
jgi:hypothetical protein